MPADGNAFYRDLGPWKPFPEPLPPPVVDPATEPFLVLKFNEVWRPYIVGCLSSLARPETYEDTLDAFIREDIDFGGQLPWLIEPFPVPTFYNWRFLQDPSQSGDSANVIVRPLVAPGIDGFFGTEFIVFNGCAGCENAHQVTGIGQQADDPFTLGVGGHVTSLYAFLLETVVGNAWSVEITDCLDSTAVFSGGGQDFLMEDFDCKHFQVNALGLFVVSLIIEADYSCTPA